jgi:hypothetical protein
MASTAIARQMDPTTRVIVRRRTAPQNRVWAPPESPVRIEYSMEVLREAARHERGLLYGIRDGATVRLVAARRDQANRDDRLAQLDLLGIYALRARGEIFMTELDMEHLERTGGSLALLVAGIQAGFFVYEPDGVIQTIKSYQEFSLFDRPPEPAPAPKKRFDRKKLWISLACLAALAVPVIAPGFQPARPLALTVRADARQLKISWTATTFPSARLEIADGSARTWIPVPADLSSATYVPVTGDVSIYLIDGTRAESAHFISADPLPVAAPVTATVAVPPPAPEIDHVQQLESQVKALRTDLTRSRQRAARLQSVVDNTVGGNQPR